MKTVEELLMQRYKVIAPYPQSSLSVGDIISFELQHVEIAQYSALNGTPIKWAVMEKEVQKYPHLFQPLPWYAEREPGDLPKYIKSKDGKHIRELIEITPDGFKVKIEECKKGYRICYNDRWEPATIDEYNEWKQSKNK